jgi:hypothetical protein
MSVDYYKYYYKILPSIRVNGGWKLLKEVWILVDLVHDSQGIAVRLGPLLAPDLKR